MNLEMIKENKIPAVYKEDLEKLLISIGEDKSIAHGERHCLVCSKVITLYNLQLIIPRAEKRFEFVCNDTECVAKYNDQEKSVTL